MTNKIIIPEKDKLECHTTIKLTRKTVNELYALAKLNKTTVSQIIRIAIENLLDNIV